MSNENPQSGQEYDLLHRDIDGRSITESNRSEGDETSDEVEILPEDVPSPSIDETQNRVNMDTAGMNQGQDNLDVKHTILGDLDHQPGGNITG